MTPEGGSSSDDESIQDETVLYRRLHPKELVWDATSDQLRPTRAAFKADEMSVNLEDEMARHGLELDFVLRDRPMHHLCAFDAGFTRSQGQAIVRDPIVGDPDLPDDPTHGNVIGKKTGATRRNFVNEAEIVVLREDSLKPEHLEAMKAAEEDEAA